jgi:hypothetical protein
LYEGQFDLVNFSTQRFDFDPGIKPDGLFWTVGFSESTVSVDDIDNGRASMSVDDLSLRDFHTIPNALMRGSSDSATVSFEIEWDGVLKEGEVRNEANRFNLDFVDTDVTVEWSATNEATGFSFESDVGSRKTSIDLGQVPFAIVGEERNGRFFE